MRITENQLRSIIRRIIKESAGDYEDVLSHPIVVRARELAKEMLETKKEKYDWYDIPELWIGGSGIEGEKSRYFLRFYLRLADDWATTSPESLKAFIDNPDLDRLKKILPHAEKYGPAFGPEEGPRRGPRGMSFGSGS
jgi:hypothetical protein